MSSKNWLVTSALLLGVGVVLGAFGSHLLAETLGVAKYATWQTAVLYHFIHALALLALSLAALAGKRFEFSGIKVGLFLGLLMFSGSLYLRVLFGWDFLVFLTPLGGSLWVVIWLWFAVKVWKSKSL